MSTNVTETLQFNCTICPSECLLTVEVERDANGAVAAVRSVTGNSCPRGDKFAHQELTCPMRVLTTTVAVSGGDEALLPVRTAEAIPLALHAQAMDLIRGVVVEAPIRMGRPYPCFRKTGKPSTCGFHFAILGVVGDIR